MIISFSKPIILLFLVLIPVIAYFYYLSIKKKKSSAIKFSSLGLIKSAMGKKKSNIRKHISIYLSLTILSLVILAIADPLIPLKHTKEGVDVVLALDDSGSMQATDYSPTRLDAAKDAAKTLVKSLNSNDYAGVVLFESGATTSAYLSPFKDKVVKKIDGIAAKQGQTAIGDGLALAVDMATSIPNKKKIVILLSDGVSNAGVISPQEAIAYAKSNKVQVYTVGLGSEGKVVLGYDWFGNPQYAELDEATLKSIAQQTGGEYFKSVDSSTLKQIYKTISNDITREREPTSIKNYILLFALLLLILQLYIQYGRYRIIQ